MEAKPCWRCGKPAFANGTGAFRYARCSDDECVAGVWSMPLSVWNTRAPSPAYQALFDAVETHLRCEAALFRFPKGLISALEAARADLGSFFQKTGGQGMKRPDYVKKDDRPQKGAWAPGSYYNRCRRCGDLFIGDKLARMCADCAYYLANSFKQES